MSISPGENVGPYRVIEQLGSGGMATVFKAYHPSLDRYVAIKVLHPAFKSDPQFFERFKREARIVANLEHPNIIPVYDFNEHHGEPYLVMRFIEGHTLKPNLDGEPLPAEQIVRLIRPVCQALDYAHKQGVLHRDIKPSNIMITKDGSVFVTDFGLARMVQAGESTLSHDVMVGTPQYISPEQAQGSKNIDGRTDIYSLGVVLYQMVTGRVPFNADTPFATVHDHIYTPLPLPSDINPKIDPAVERLLLKALAKNPDDRYATAADLLAAIETTLGQQTVLHSPPAPPVQPAKKGGIPWWVWAGAGAAILLLIGLVLAGLLLLRNRNRQSTPPNNQPVAGPVTNPDAPSADQPPVDAPPPAGEQPADQPPPGADQPPDRDQPPADQPPADAPPNVQEAQELTRQANNAMRDKNYDQAMDLYRQAIEANPHFLPAYFGLSDAQSLTGDDAASIATLESAVENNPREMLAWGRLGEGQLFTERNPEAALASFQEAAALAPNDPGPLAGQAIAQTAMGQYDAAKESIDRAMALDPESPE
ncbi:MAG: hypothetical protein D6768_18180, partial [Chloroflexi bacterium]